MKRVPEIKSTGFHDELQKKGLRAKKLFKNSQKVKFDVFFMLFYQAKKID